MAFMTGNDEPVPLLLQCRTRLESLVAEVFALESLEMTP